MDCDNGNTEHPYSDHTVSSCNILILKSLCKSGPSRKEIHPVKKHAFKIALTAFVLINFHYFSPLLFYLISFSRGIQLHVNHQLCELNKCFLEQFNSVSELSGPDQTAAQHEMSLWVNC